MPRRYIDNFKYEIKSNNKIFALVIILLTAYILTKLLPLLNNPNITQKIFSFIYMPVIVEEFIKRFWTIFTQIFLSYNFSQLILSITTLIIFGNIFNVWYGRNNLLKIFVIGGITGAFFYLMSYNIYPDFSKYPTNNYIKGSMAPVLAIATSCVLFAPNYKISLLFFGNISIKYIYLILIILDVLNIYPHSVSWHLTDVGGIITGISYFYSKKYNILSSFSLFKKSKDIKIDISYNHKRPLSDDEYNHLKVERQKKVDEILDKISKSGYDSLTKEEKEFLFNYSKKNL